mmetsp:Transcript_20561/g.42887  ORF Transcript_20561/g.42887 Transcript_20561/m.42887 type:complete len:254 (-) Transcript_20561:1697-2458(-)
MQITTLIMQKKEETHHMLHKQYTLLIFTHDRLHIHLRMTRQITNHEQWINARRDGNVHRVQVGRVPNNDTARRFGFLYANGAASAATSAAINIDRRCPRHDRVRTQLAIEAVPAAKAGFRAKRSALAPAHSADVVVHQVDRAIVLHGPTLLADQRPGVERLVDARFGEHAVVVPVDHDGSALFRAVARGLSGQSMSAGDLAFESRLGRVYDGAGRMRVATLDHGQHGASGILQDYELPSHLHHETIAVRFPVG